jgi:outer membrane protein OmpA-like peptidoglycan-associated protein
MKNLTFIPITLMLCVPVHAQENVTITFADGTTQTVFFDEIPEIAGSTPAAGLLKPVIAGPIAPGVTVTNDDTGVVADISLAPVYGQGQDTGVVGEYKAEPVYGNVPNTGVTVRITEPVPPPQPNPPRPAIAEMSFPGMNFETNKYAITPEGMKRVNLVAQIMIANPALCIRITGHTDNVGSGEANYLLSQNRAESFRQSLIDHHGIAPNRIETRGMGENQPVESNETEEGRYANRRIVITPI